MELKYIVYITINLCNGKFYIGVHKTNPDVFDGYIGCGVYSISTAKENYPFHKAVRKYGYQNFKRTTICIFPDTDEGKQEAYELEKTLVNATLLKSKSVYNVVEGGINRTLCTKRVYQFALNGEFLRSYKSCLIAALSLLTGNLNSALCSIKNCCRKETATAFGYYWSYTKKFENRNKKQVPIAQYTISGKFLRYFNSIVQAEELLNIHDIKQAIKNNSSAGGYQWRYWKNDPTNIGTLNNVATRNKKLPIYIVNILNGEREDFASVIDCIKQHPNFKASLINRVLKNIIRSHLGYRFFYKDEDIV